MPITEELKNIQKLESVGFDHKQAEALADIIEHAQGSGIESLKEFIHSEITGLNNKIESLDNKIEGLDNKIDNKIESLDNKIEGLDNKIDNKIESLDNKIDNKIESLDNKIEGLDNKIDNKIESLRNELKADIAISSKDLLVKLFGIIVGTIGIAVTILKLFP